MCDAFFLRYGSSWRQIHRHTKPFRFCRPCHFSGLYWHPTWRSIGMPKRQCSHQLGADLHPDNNFSITTGNIGSRLREKSHPSHLLGMLSHWNLEKKLQDVASNSSIQHSRISIWRILRHWLWHDLERSPWQSPDSAWPTTHSPSCSSFRKRSGLKSILICKMGHLAATRTRSTSDDANF